LFVAAVYALQPQSLVFAWQVAWLADCTIAALCVQVSDIKRANGILSDNAMFAREHIKIPTGSIPLR
jgi:hypothetical protein